MTTIVVAAAVIEDFNDIEDTGANGDIRDSGHRSRLLVTRRQHGVHLEGYWEFPGGKCHPGEPLERCLARELREELAVEVTVGTKILATTHAYPDLCVELHFFWCRLLGTPVPQIGQEMRWVTRGELGGLRFPPADTELIQWLARQA
jgi:8-oxo-dGTP diphosphatase